MKKKPDLGNLVAAALPKAALPAVLTDGVEKGPRRAVGDDVGAKHSIAAAAQTFLVRAPDTQSTPQKDAERLKILSRSALYQQAERRWLERFSAKLQMAAPQAARKLGFGPWRKKYADKAALVAGLGEHIGPLFAQTWGLSAPELTASGDDEYFACAFTPLTGEPPLHPEYLRDATAYALRVNQDDIKHVCHGYVMVLGHAWIRALVERKRQQSIGEVAEATGLLPEHLFALEVNLVQHYVPSTLSAYFEHQPMRALARELANSFRKLAFGGQ